MPVSYKETFSLLRFAAFTACQRTDRKRSLFMLFMVTAVNLLLFLIVSLDFLSGHSISPLGYAHAPLSCQQFISRTNFARTDLPAPAHKITDNSLKYKVIFHTISLCMAHISKMYGRTAEKFKQHRIKAN